MADTRAAETSSTTQAGETSGRGLVSTASSVTVVSPSKQTKGKTTIATGVVAKIVGIAAREIEGVKELVSVGAAASITGLATRFTGADTHAKGVSVEVGEREAAASINIVAIYGINIPQLAEAIRRNVIDRVEAMTGLNVIAVDIAVIDLYFPEEETERARVQ
jgi:uncharacterized alkaline shock family protein YloU